MSYIQEKEPNYEPEWTSSPKSQRSNVPNQETLFEFFKQKSRRDLDRSFSSARKTRRKSEIPDSPNVKLFKELNTSASPKKQRKLPPSAQSPRVITNPLRMPSPLKAADARLYTSKDDTESVNESKEQEAPATPAGPLFLRLIQSGSRTKAKPDVPMIPKPSRRFSATMPKDSQRLEETDGQLNGRLVTGCETGTMEDFNCINMNTRSSFAGEKRSPLARRSPPARRSPRTPSPKQRRSPGSPRSPSLTHEIKLFGERQRMSMSEGNNVVSYVRDYERKYAELNSYMQKQAKQINRITQLLERDQEECDLFQLRIFVDDLGLTTMAASKHLSEGLLDVNEVLEVVDSMEQRYRQEVRDLNDAIDHSRSALKGGKEENQEKLEDLLSYIEGLKGNKPSSSHSVSRERKSYNDDSKWKRQIDTETQELEMQKMKENVVQMRGVIQSLELQVKELKKENQTYREQNTCLKESQTALKKEADAFRKEAEMLRNDLNAVLLTQEQEEREELRRRSSNGLKEKSRNIKSRQGSPSRGERSRQSSPSRTEKGLIKKAEQYQGQESEVETLKTEVEYLKYKANTLAKDNEDLIKRLTDKVLIEREMKVMKAKNQELSDIVHTKAKENEAMSKVIKEARDKLGVNGGSAFAIICKQNGLEDRNRPGRMTHW